MSSKKLFYTITLICPFSICSILSFAQLRFERVYGGTQTDIANTIINTNDGGYLMAGRTQSYGGSYLGDNDAYIIKTDSTGKTEWAKTYGDSEMEEAFSIEKVNSGYFILGNAVNLSTTYSAVNLLHIDDKGNLLWNKIYTINNDARGSVIKKINSNQFVISGATYKDADNDKEIFLLKIDSTGNVIWGRGYNGNEFYTDVPNNISFTNDGGFVITGNSFYVATHDYNIICIKIDSNGNQQWINTYAPSRNTRGTAAYQLSNGGYIIGGQFVNPETGADMLLIRVDSIGNVIWNRKYGGDGIDFNHGFILSKKGFVLIGETSSFSSDKTFDAFIVRTDTQGLVLSSFVYGDTGKYESGISAVETKDTGLAIVGTSIGFGTGLEDFFFVRTTNDDSSGCFESNITPINNPIATTPVSYSNQDTISATITDKTPLVQSGYKDTIICYQYLIHTKPDTDTTNTYTLQILKNNEITIYPNPSAGSFTVKLPPDLNNYQSLRLYNYLGVDVTNSFKIESKNSSLINVSASNIPDGNYYIRIVNEQRSVTIKISLTR